MPETSGRRGAGLGNELHGWAKAYIASRVLGARLLPPAWGLNPRGYRAYFGTPRLDWAYQAALKRTLPTVRLSRDDFDSDYGSDFRVIVRKHAERHELLERRHYVLITGGMWGGLGMLRESFPFLRRMLLSATNTVSNLADLSLRVQPDVLTIALHIRRGDFVPAAPDSAARLESRWNTAIPLEWYVSVCRSIRDQLTVPHQFMLFSDGHEAELRPLLSAIDLVTTSHQRMNVCSDLLAMMEADLLITSRSSFSLWAAALSNKPYIWHADDLVSVGDGSLSLWDHGQAMTQREAVAPRGVAVDQGGHVDDGLITYLAEVGSRRGWRSDLVFYGRVTDDKTA